LLNVAARPIFGFDEVGVTAAAASGWEIGAGVVSAIVQEQCYCGIISVFCVTAGVSAKFSQIQRFREIIRILLQCSDTVVVFSERIELPLKKDIKSESLP
jgi:hypothetical protein